MALPWAPRTSRPCLSLCLLLSSSLVPREAAEGEQRHKGVETITLQVSEERQNSGSWADVLHFRQNGLRSYKASLLG